ncbi:hypothetical protein HYH03_005199 [Edaphochlamys debaryana]|uniref:Carbohydrate kinase PfkB domain-containing protein n=1 Tax=Edaphochlamys debaryana TaxID=47281 RepID=A0A835Y9P8_9CHLO|nr:hypothetical protein HYH03_005199 [Edaphochlamys debaryana]|eukprot:KAG2496791.1 hypothetical protein HYH03_005199 [Edaphochlamys debaryana]
MVAETPKPSDVPMVVGLGDPVMDILAQVSAEWLTTVAPEPGGCLPVSPKEMEELLASAATQSQLDRIPGGSAANVVKGIAQIAGADARCSFVGMVAKDETGAEYRRKVSACGVQPLLLESSSGAPSASAVCFVTPDGQRTMRTCLGASLELQTASMLPRGWAKGCRLLHAEGYCLYRPQLAREMMCAARATGALVSLDLASFELVRNCKAALLGLLKDGLVDLIFANEEEAVTLANELDLPLEAEADAAANGGSAAVAAALLGAGGAVSEVDAKVAAAQRFLLSPEGGRCQVAVTSLGARGCVARGADGELGASPACRVKVVDTIGAGDFFTAGFLAAYLRGGSLQQCAAAGCASGCEAVQAKGAELPAESFERLRAAMGRILITEATSASSAAAGKGEQAGNGKQAVAVEASSAVPVLV